MSVKVLNSGDYLEHNLVNDLFALEVEELVSKGLLQKTGARLKVNFAGLVITSDQLIISLPKTLDYENQQLSKVQLAQLLFQVFKKYFSSSQRKSLSVEPDQVRSNIINGISAEKILIDYVRNGYLNFHSKELSKNYSGKIDWGRTINKINPIHSQQNVVYSDVLAEKKTTEKKLITDIHKLIVYECWEKIGTLLDLPVPDYINLNLHRSKMVYVLQNFLRNVYDNKRINTLKILLRYLKTGSVSQQASSEFYLGSTNFDLVWEDICLNLFKVSELKTLNSKLGFEWKDSQLLGGEEYTNTIIPDILVRDDDSLFVVDAKNYNLKKSRPGQADLWKQFYYAVSMDTIAKENNLSLANLLFFPSLKNTLDDSNIKLLSTIYPTINESREDIHQPIYCFGLDLIECMKVYTSKEEWFSLKQPIKEGIQYNI